MEAREKLLRLALEVASRTESCVPYLSMLPRVEECAQRMRGLAEEEEPGGKEGTWLDLSALVSTAVPLISSHLE